MSRKLVRQFLNDLFAKELTLSPELSQKYEIATSEDKPVRSEFTESHFLLLLLSHPEMLKPIKEYLESPDSAKDPNQAVDAQEKVVLQKRHTEWRKFFRGLVSSQKIADQFKSILDPFNPLELSVSNSEPGYSDARLFATTGSSTLKSANMKNAWLSFIKEAKKEIILNVFDFDLADIKDALVAQKKAGLSVRVGIDSGVIASRPEVKAIFDSLNSSGVQVVAVDSVGLNHQKIAARDWSTPEAAVILSSGNLTQSCIGPEGDLKGREAKVVNSSDLKFSIPNANHAIVLKSRVLSQIVLNELSKTLEFKLKGSAYPQSGIYRVYGKVGPNGSKPYITIAFSPRGGFGDLNRDFIKQAVRRTSGPVKMLQFAFSSKTIEEALYDRAKKESTAGKTFTFQSVGDTPFALRDWSVFLSMSGFRFRPPTETTSAPFYVETQKTDIQQGLFRWQDVINIETLRDNIKVAPAVYGTHSVKIREQDGTVTSVPVTSKIHHKVLLSGGLAIIGTSYNFSENAVKNQEQLVATTDPELYKAAEAMFEDLNNNTSETVVSKVKWRNDPSHGWGRVSEPEDREDGANNSSK